MDPFPKLKQLKPYSRRCITLLPSSSPTACLLNCTTLAPPNPGIHSFIVRVEYIEIVEVRCAGRVEDLQHVGQLWLRIAAGPRRTAGVGVGRRVGAGGGRAAAAALAAQAAVLPHAWGHTGEHVIYATEPRSHVI